MLSLVTTGSRRRIWTKSSKLVKFLSATAQGFAAYRYLQHMHRQNMAAKCECTRKSEYLAKS